MTAPVGYLVTVGVVALCTLLALAPVRRPWSLGLLSYLCAHLVCELPFLFLHYLIASTTLAVNQGADASTAGWVAFAVAGLTAAGLALVARRGLQAGRALTHALAEGLGVNWRAAIDPKLRPLIYRFARHGWVCVSANYRLVGTPRFPTS